MEFLIQVSSRLKIILPSGDFLSIETRRIEDEIKRIIWSKCSF